MVEVSAHLEARLAHPKRANAVVRVGPEEVAETARERRRPIAPWSPIAAYFLAQWLSL
jgi:hypothetical protein